MLRSMFHDFKNHQLSLVDYFDKCAVTNDNQTCNCEVPYRVPPTSIQNMSQTSLIYFSFPKEVLLHSLARVSLIHLTMPSPTFNAFQRKSIFMQRNVGIWESTESEKWFKLLMNLKYRASFISTDFTATFVQCFSLLSVAFRTFQTIFSYCWGYRRATVRHCAPLLLTFVTHTHTHILAAWCQAGRAYVRLALLAQPTFVRRIGGSF